MTDCMVKCWVDLNRSHNCEYHSDTTNVYLFMTLVVSLSTFAEIHNDSRALHAIAFCREFAC